MGNRSGRNSVYEHDVEPVVPYGEKSAAAALQKTAPVAGEQASNEMLGTPARASALGKKQAEVQAAKPVEAAAEPVIPAAAVVQAPLSASEQAWQAIAAEPGASPLVKAYAAGQVAG